MKRSSLPGPQLWPVLFVFLLLAACNSTEEPADPLAREGLRLFKRHCASCHSLKPGRVSTGPSLAGIASAAGGRITDIEAQEYLYQSITAPNAFIVEEFSDLMPTDFADKLDSEELNAVVAYLLTLE